MTSAATPTARALLGAAGLCVALSGCATANVDAPPSASSGPSISANPTTGPSPSASTEPTEEPTEEPTVYAWVLPPSDTGVSGNDGPAYADLRRGCDEGQAALDARAPTGGIGNHGFRSPRNVMVFAAGIAVCRGDTSTAWQYMDRAIEDYGLSGLYPPGEWNPRPPECDLYQSVRSVLEQAPRESFECPGGAAPAYLTATYTDEDGIIVTLTDDPVTLDVDERIPQTSPPDDGGTSEPLTPSPDDGSDELPAEHDSDVIAPDTQATDGSAG